ADARAPGPLRGRRVERLAVVEPAVRALELAGLAVDDGVRLDRRAHAAAREARDDVRAADLDRRGIELEVADDLLLRAEEVLLARVEQEVVEAAVGEGVVRVEPEAPHVLRDDEQAHAIGRAAAERDAEHERELIEAAEVARRLVDERLVVALAGCDEHL